MQKAMFTEEEIINKIKQLKKIEPDREWVFLAKRNILKDDNLSLKEKGSFSFAKYISFFNFGFNKKFIFATLSFFIFFSALIVFSQSSLPGSPLFTLKRATEKAQAMLIPRQDQLNYDMAIAEKRLSELKEIAEKNSVENLAPAINEYQASVSKIAQNLAETKNKNEIKRIVEKVQKLKKQELKIESSASLVVPDNKKLEEASAEKLIPILNSLVSDLKNNQSLTKEQKIALEKVENDLKEKKYNDALIILLAPPLNASD